MMKRILVLMLAVLTVFSLSACGAQSGTGNKNDPHAAEIDSASVSQSIVAPQYTIKRNPYNEPLLITDWFIACLNTCIGLLTCCSDYFHKLLPKISYKAWVVFFAASSMIVANAGLDTILSVSVPVLGAIYPVCILLILLGICHHWIEKLPLIYPVSVLFTGVISILTMVRDLGWAGKALDPFFELLPLNSQGLPWLLPALAGIALGALLSVAGRKKA